MRTALLLALVLPGCALGGRSDLLFMEDGSAIDAPVTELPDGCTYNAVAPAPCPDGLFLAVCGGEVPAECCAWNPNGTCYPHTAGIHSVCCP